MNHRAGYSLFEVLIAFAIMSLVLAVLIPSQSLLLRRTTTSAERTLAQDFAVSRMEAAGIETELQPGVRESDYRTWKLRENVVQADNIAGKLVYLVTIEVLGADGRQLAQFSAPKVAHEHP